MSLKILIFLRKGDPDKFTKDRALFIEALESMGSLSIFYDGNETPKEEQMQRIREHDVAIMFHGSILLPAELKDDMGRLKLACGALGSVRAYVARELIEAGLPVTNWGTSPAYGIAEGAFTLLLATMKNLHRQIRIIREDGWKMPREDTGGSMRNLNMGIYGCGVIGRKFLEFVKPFEPNVSVFDPYAKELPEWVDRVDSLHDLFASSQVIVIHAGLTDESRKSVTAELLALLPEGGVIINTARGGIIDQDALFKELESGRLRAGLDVLDPDWLPPGNPAKLWDNCIFTGHSVDRGWPLFGKPRKELNNSELLCLENIQNMLDGKSLKFSIDTIQYDRMT